MKYYLLLLTSLFLIGCQERVIYSELSLQEKFNTKIYMIGMQMY